MQKKLRVRKLVLFLSFLCLAGILYIFVWHLTGWGLPCVFKELMHLQCPGCGVTRMFFSLLKFDLAEAFRYNKGILLALPFLAVLFVLLCKSYIKNGTLSLPKWANILLWIIIIWLFIFGFVRNFRQGSGPMLFLL